MNVTLSLAIIVKDDAKGLDRCLNSVKDVLDEIIIVDTGSTDNTKEVAYKYTDKVYDFEWIDDFAAARNFSFSKCTKDYILWLDSDDEVKKEDCDKIRNLDYTDKDMIVCDYVYSHDEHDRGIDIVPRERIIKRSLSLKWVGEIHECIILTNNYYRSDIKIHHYKTKGNSDRNLRMLERIIKKNPNDARNTYYLGKEYYGFGEIDKAIEMLEHHVNKTTGWYEYRYKAFYYLAICYMHKKNNEKFLDSIYNSLRVEGHWAEPYNLLGMYFFGINQYHRAIQWFKFCLEIDRPKNLLDSYISDYYDFLPCLQLCVCYFRIGNIEESIKYHKRTVELKPYEKNVIENAKFFNIHTDTKKEGSNRKLNLGCGDKLIEGFINVDIFDSEGVDEKFDLDDIPYKNNSISAINSEHSLEHLPFERVKKALKEWFRVLKCGGELFLKIPDFELCVKNYINSPLLDRDFSKTKAWYKCTIYGWQRSLKGEPDEAQIHKSGFSKEEISILLKEAGFTIISLKNYDGYATPSIDVKAIKPYEDINVGWITPEDWNYGPTRLRVLNVDKWLKSQGYNSKVIEYSEALNENYNIIVVGQLYNEFHYNNIKKLKDRKKTIICDICEDILFDQWVVKILKISNYVVCCSHDLEKKVKEINRNTYVIEEAYETV